MNFDRELWKGYYKNIPKFSCPYRECQRGHLIFQEESLSKREPEYSCLSFACDAWEPDWRIQRFIAFLVCDNRDCGEAVTMSGRIITESWYGHEEHHAEVSECFEIKSLFPSPPLINIPKKTSTRVREEIEVAFQLYWVDFGACATRLRLSIEKLLDALGISKAHKKESLERRIERYQQIHPDHAAIMKALKFLGNLGAHFDEEKVSQEALLDGFEIFEYALEEIYEKRKDTVNKLTQKLITTEGNYNSLYDIPF